MFCKEAATHPIAQQVFPRDDADQFVLGVHHWKVAQAKLVEKIVDAQVADVLKAEEYFWETASFS